MGRPASSSTRPPRTALAVVSDFTTGAAEPAGSRAASAGPLHPDEVRAAAAMADRGRIERSMTVPIVDAAFSGCQKIVSPTWCASRLARPLNGGGVRECAHDEARGLLHKAVQNAGRER